MEESPMILHWKVRYLDRADKQFKDRYFYLNTMTLDPVTRAAVELVAENRSYKTEREILKYRHLFVEVTLQQMLGNPEGFSGLIGVNPSEYFEDEAGKEITRNEMAQILTGSPTARFLPAGAKQHDIDFMFAGRRPVPLAEVSLSPEEIRVLGYFVRDLQEMQNSTFVKDGPGTLQSLGGLTLSPISNPSLKTASTDDEIRSFVMIFRRLYMTSERDPANFLRIIPIVITALGGHPLGTWIEATAKQYESHQAAVFDAPPFVPPGTCTFTTKRLIDVFLYTQYVHQPDERRQRQFDECLGQLHGKRELLAWLFLVEIWNCALQIGNAGRMISWWFKAYCDHHGVTPDVLRSLRDDHPGLGAAEKEEDREARLYQEKVEQLAADLWEQAGRPNGGLSQFLATAREELTHRLEN